MVERVQLSQVALRRTPEISTVPIGAGASNALASSIEDFGQKLSQAGLTMARLAADKEFQAGSDQGSRAGYQAAQPDVSGNIGPPPKEQANAFPSGRGYNRAAIQAYYDGIKVTSGDAIERIYQENKSDPVGLQTKLDAYYKTTEAQLNQSTPELLAGYRDFFDRSSRPYLRQVAADHEQNVTSQELAQLEQTRVTKQRQLEQRAFVGGNTPEAMADVAIGRHDYMTDLVRAGPKEGFKLEGADYPPDATRTGALSADKIQKELIATDQSLMEARYKGQFDRARKAGRGDQFALGFMNSDAVLKDMTPEQRTSVGTWMHAQLTMEKSLNEARDNALGKAVEAAAGSLAAGQMPGGLDSLTAQARGTKYEQPLALAVRNQDTMHTFMSLRPGDQIAAVAHQSENLKAVSPAALGNEKYAGEVRARTSLIESMRKGIEATRHGLETDGFAFAQQAGVIPPAPPIVNAQGQVDPMAMQSRADSARMANHYYGHQIAPMTDGEIADFGARQQQLPAEAQAQSLGALIDGFGNDGAAPVFEALHKKGYTLDAAAGGIAMEPTAAGRGAPDARTTAGLILEGRSALHPADGTASALVIPHDMLQTSLQDSLGGVMAKNPTGRATAEDAVTSVYAALSARAGNYKQAGVDTKRMGQAVTMVFGGPLIDFDTPGWGAHVKLTPPFRGAQQADFDGWWNGLSAADLKAAGGLSAYTDEAAAELVRERGIPVEIGQGRYLIAIDGMYDDAALSPTARNKGGKPLVLTFPVDKFIR